MTVFNKILFLVAALTALGCKPRNLASREATQSPFVEFYQASVKNGELLTSPSEGDYKAAVEKQLSYLRGQFEYRFIGFAQSEMQIKIVSRKYENGLMRIAYDANFLLSGAWLDTSVGALVPFNVSENGEAFFYESFHRSCSLKEEDKGNFFLNFVPTIQRSNNPCPFLELAYKTPLNNEMLQVDDNEVILLSIGLTKHRDATGLEKPDYKRVWQDGTLEVVFINVAYSENNNAKNDDGYNAHANVIEELVKKYGEPVRNASMVKKARSERYVRLDFELPEEKMLIVHSLIVDSVSLERLVAAGFARQVAAKQINDFEVALKQATPDADLIIYSGHSGAYVQRIYELLNLRPDHYYIFYANGCNTLAGGAVELNRKIQELNPNDPPSKFVDIIGNTLQSSVTNVQSTHQTWIEVLIEGTKSYKSILQTTNPMAKPYVCNEHDN